MNLPLEGIRVIELGQIYAVPYCTLQLAHMGAEIIKIEPPNTGEFLRLPEISPGGVNYTFLMLNADKKSVTLNLKDPRGREILLRLLKDADVLVENYSATAIAQLELGYEKIAPALPRLIYASAKGYGNNSRWENLGAMDFLVQASAGLMSVTGYADRPGVKTPATFIDMGTGMHLVAGILAALLQREKSGRGQKIEVAMHDVCIPALTSLIAPVLEGRHVKRLGNRHLGACPCNVYRALDGEIAIFCLTEPHWRTLTRLLEREDLLSDPHYANHKTRIRMVEEVDLIIETWTRQQKRDAMVELLIANGIPCAPVRTVEEVAQDPELASRGMLVPSEYPTRGAISVTGSPIKFSDFPEWSPSPPPELGEHNDEVLGSIGLGQLDLERLRRDGVI
jgi:formyl-CoA transferase